MNDALSFYMPLKYNRKGVSLELYGNATITLFSIGWRTVRKSSPESGGYHPRAWVWFWVVGGAEAGLLTWHDKELL